MKRLAMSILVPAILWAQIGLGVAAPVQQPAAAEATESQASFLGYDSPLMRAAYRNDARALRGLIATYGNALSSDAMGRSALHAAASGGAFDTAHMLLEQGVTVDARDLQGATPLMYAILSGKLVLVVLLLAKGADPDAAMTEGGHVPLDLALFRRDHAIMQKLLAAGAHPARAGGHAFLVGLADWNTTRAVAGLQGRKLELVESDELALLGVLAAHPEWPQLVNARGSNQETALMVAAEGAPLSIVRFLLDHGADADARDHNQLLASDWALMADGREAVYCLIASRQQAATRSGLTRNGAPIPTAELPRCGE